MSTPTPEFQIGRSKLGISSEVPIDLFKDNKIDYINCITPFKQLDRDYASIYQRANLQDPSGRTGLAVTAAYRQYIYIIRMSNQKS